MEKLNPKIIVNFYIQTKRVVIYEMDFHSTTLPPIFRNVKGTNLNLIEFVQKDELMSIIITTFKINTF